MKKSYFNYFKNCDKILDIGCGDGRVAKLIGKKNKFIGIDKTLTYPPKSNIYTKTIELDIDGKELPFKHTYFDGVLANNIIEHIFNYELLMEEINRVLKTEGKLLVRVPDYRSKNAWNDYTHIRPYTSQSIKALLSDFGFKVEKVEAIGGLPLLAKLFGFKTKNKIIDKIPLFLPALSWKLYAIKK